jgi:hypothetical protein
VPVHTTSWTCFGLSAMTSPASPTESCITYYGFFAGIEIFVPTLTLYY